MLLVLSRFLRNFEKLSLMSQKLSRSTWISLESVWKASKIIPLKGQSYQDLVVLENPVKVLVTKIACNSCGQKSSLKFDKVGSTFSSLTMLLGGKSLKTIDLLEIEINLDCPLKVIFLTSG